MLNNGYMGFCVLFILHLHIFEVCYHKRQFRVLSEKNRSIAEYHLYKLKIHMCIKHHHITIFFNDTDTLGIYGGRKIKMEIVDK